MKTTLALAGTLLLLSMNVYADDTDAEAKRLDQKGDRIENRLDNKGDRIEQRLDNRGDRIEDLLDKRADKARAAGHDGKADRLEAKGDRIDVHLDKKGERINHHLDRKGKRRYFSLVSRAMRASQKFLVTTNFHCSLKAS